MESPRRWWSTNRFRHQPLETKLLYSQARMVLYYIFRILLGFLYQVGASSANSNPGAGEHKDHFLEINTQKTGRHTYTERLQSHLGDTEIPIGRTDLPRVCCSGYDIWTRWRRIERIGGAEFYFRFRTYVEMRKWLRAFGAYISLSILSKQAIKQHLIPPW